MKLKKVPYFVYTVLHDLYIVIITIASFIEDAIVLRREERKK